MSETKAHVPFTEITWESLDYKLSNESRLGWQAQCDLEYELLPLTQLTLEHLRVLVAAVSSGPKPVIVTIQHTNWHGGSSQTWEDTFVATLDHLNVHPNGRHSVQYSSWGFGGPLYLDKIVDIKTPEQTTRLIRTS